MSLTASMLRTTSMTLLITTGASGLLQTRADRTVARVMLEVF